MPSLQPTAEQLNRAYLLSPSKAASIVGNLVSYLLHVPLDDRHVEPLSSPDMACTLDVMLLPNGTPIAIPTFRSQGAEMRVLVPIVGAPARHWVKDCLLLRRMELLLAGKSRAGCLCISIENHARWFRAAAEGRPGSRRSRAPCSDLLEAMELLRKRRPADISEQSFFGVGASFGTADEQK